MNQTINQEIYKKISEILSTKQQEVFEKLFDLYTEWNSKINISAIKNKEDVYTKHFIDSLYANFLGLDFDSKKILDIATGGGYPLLPLSITNPKGYFFGVDCVKKKLLVIENISKSLNLRNIFLFHEKIENLSKKSFSQEERIIFEKKIFENGENKLETFFLEEKKFRKYFDFITVRAFSSIENILILSSNLIKKGGKIILYQTIQKLGEFKENKNLMENIGFKIFKIQEFDLPLEKGKRILIVLEL